MSIHFADVHTISVCECDTVGWYKLNSTPPILYTLLIYSFNRLQPLVFPSTNHPTQYITRVWSFTALTYHIYTWTTIKIHFCFRRHQNWHEKGCSTCQITSTLHVCPTVDCALLPLTSILWTRKTGQFFRCSKYRITLNSIRFVAMGKRIVLGCFRRFHFVSCHRIYEWKRCFRAFEGCQCRSISWSYDPGI